MPEQIAGPILFNSPHSGRVYPPAFKSASRLGSLALRRSEDAFVDELISVVVPLGLPLLKANFPRAYVDVNREPYELDPDMFAGELPVQANTRSLRVAGGLGTIPKIVAEAAEIYEGPLPVSVAHERIEDLYRPYHLMIAETLSHLRSIFGFAILIDCHSMPSGGPKLKPPRPDFVLGDRFGSSCAPQLIDTAERRLTLMGYSVASNRPYAGGHITQTYGRPADGLHALQIEMNRKLYLKENTITRSVGFGPLRHNLRAFAMEILQAASYGGLGVREAAE